MLGGTRSREMVALLDVDPDLASDLDPKEAKAARQRAVGAVLKINSVDWDPTSVSEAASAGWLGLY